MTVAPASASEPNELGTRKVGVAPTGAGKVHGAPCSLGNEEVQLEVAICARRSLPERGSSRLGVRQSLSSGCR